jgi:dienelactone hydrolase
MIAVVLLLFGFLCVLPCAAQNALDGDWIGGIDFGNSWQSINLHFKTENEKLTGTLDLPEQGRNGLPLDRVVVDSSHVRIEWQGRSGLAIYEGEFRDGGIIGSFQQGETKATFILAHEARINPKIYDRYAGSYKLAPGRFIDIGPDDGSDGRLRFLDSRTGRFGVLYPSSESEFFSGPSFSIPLPVDIRIKFIRNEQGEATGLSWQQGNSGALSARKVSPYKKEEVTFRNGEATLTGTLVLPLKKGPYPAIVLVSPGYSLYRQNGVYPYFFVRQGLAFFALDTRSVSGKSVNYLHSSFEERAEDVLAGVRLLKARKDIKPNQIGLWGSSLSSWIAPLAATLSPDIAFLILKVPSALPVTENILYEIESDMREAGFSESDIAKAKSLRKLLSTTILTNTGWETVKAEVEKSKAEKWFGYARVGWVLSIKVPPDSATLEGLQGPIRYDPFPVLEKITCPVLVINGELDKSVDTKVSVPTMKRALQKARNKDYTIIVLPKANHGLAESVTGYGSEGARNKRFVVEYWNTMAAWFRTHVKVDK